MGPGGINKQSLPGVSASISVGLSKDDHDSGCHDTTKSSMQNSIFYEHQSMFLLEILRVECF